MIIHHGGYCEIKTPEIRQSRSNKDFGPGFYCTQLRSQAERWARCFDTPVVSVFDYSEPAGLKVLQFPQMTEEWLDFIAHCRNGVPHEYDIVSGAMANDQIWNYVADFINGVITREAFWALAKFKQPTHQIVFCSESTLETLTFRESFEVKK